MIVSIVGAGNMAHQLGSGLKAANHQIHQIYNRTYSKGLSLAKILEAKAVKEVNELDSNIDLLLLAISDDALTCIVDDLDLRRWKTVLVAHTSGSAPMSVLSNFKSYGVFYPFQTMTIGQEVDFGQVPILVTANDLNSQSSLMKLAYSLSDKANYISDEQRLVVHIAGVFANNFTNHMLVLSKQILEKEDLQFELLKPLIANTFKKIIDLLPEQSQTGPAIRGDIKTIKTHLKWLSGYPNLRKIYHLLTKSISKVHKSESEDRQPGSRFTNI